MPECEPAPPPAIAASWTGSRPAGTWAWIRCCCLKKIWSFCFAYLSPTQNLRLDVALVSHWFNPPVLSRMMALSLGLKRASVLLSINSTTTDWMRTSMKAAVPLKQADSICLDLKEAEGPYKFTPKPRLKLRATFKDSDLSGTHRTRLPQTHLRRLGAQTMARFLVCMFVVELKVARWERCRMRYSRVLWGGRRKRVWLFEEKKR